MKYADENWRKKNTKQSFGIISMAIFQELNALEINRYKFFLGRATHRYTDLPDAGCKSSFWIEWFPIIYLNFCFWHVTFYKSHSKWLHFSRPFFLHFTSFGSCSLDVFFSRVAFILISANQLKVYRFLLIITFSLWEGEDKNEMCAVCENGAKFVIPHLKIVDRFFPRIHSKCICE